jgi:hypothetical protein
MSIRDATLSPIHTLATVTCGARFEKTGDRIIDFEISYLLEKTDDEWRILSYTSCSDQNAAMGTRRLAPCGQSTPTARWRSSPVGHVEGGDGGALADDETHRSKIDCDLAGVREDVDPEQPVAGIVADRR